MSDAQREESASVREVDWPSVTDFFRSWYHVPLLATMFVLMLWMRLRAYGNFIRDGRVFFAGNDAWYHLRQVQFTVRNWPATMPFDPWTYFPYGTSVGQFGTVYDQLVATAALVVGLGDPSQALVAKTLLVAPAVFGSLVLIPTYLIGRRLGGRPAGLFGAAILTLLPGVFLRRGLVGFADHNIAEPLFQGFAVAAILAALGVAKREKPVWELVAARDVDAIRRPLVWSALAGAATALYMWVWPPGVLLVGIVGAFLLLYVTGEYVTGVSPEPVAFVGAVSMAVTGALMLTPITTVSFHTARFSLLQPLLAFLVAGGCVFLAALARRWDGLEAPAWGYPAAVFGLIAVGAVVIRFALPGLFSLIETNLLRIVGFSATAQVRTIGEAQPFLDSGLLDRQGMTRVNRIMSEYGFTLFTGVLAAVWMLGKPLVERNDARGLGYLVGGLSVLGLLFVAPQIQANVGAAVGVSGQLLALIVAVVVIAGAVFLASHDPETLFVVVWAAFITAAAFTQVRFNYYLAVVVAVMNAYLVGQLFAYLDLGSFDRLSEVEGYQVLAVVAAVLLILAPVLVVPLDVRDTGNPAYDRSSTAWESAKSTGPGAVTQWEGSLQWMNNSTPPEGQYGGADNEMAYYGTYERADDYEYPKGAYGVQSWWDYGHWITTVGHRIPNANPFQQGASSAANFLLAPNEEQAREVLRNQSTEGERTRYVMVDWKMATPGTSRSKFSAPLVWYDGDLPRSEMYHRVYDIRNERVQSTFLHRHQRYYESLMVRLYTYHGSAVEPQPIVVDWDSREVPTQSGEQTTIRTTPTGANESVLKQFDNMSAARQYVEEDGSAQVGGVGRFPAERVPALQHYRVVKVSNSSAVDSNAYRSGLLQQARTLGLPPQTLLQTFPSWVKTFERVPGATVEGSGAAPNATVTARAEMRVPTSGNTFTYVQRAQADENGDFTMTLPYSTTGYDRYGPENGYTNVSVRATGPYTITTPGEVNESNYVVQRGANVSIDEGLVNGAEDGPKRVELTERSRQIQVQNGNGTQSTGDAADGDSATNVSVDDGANGSATSDEGTSTPADDGNESDAGALAAPALAGVEVRDGGSADARTVPTARGA